MSNMLRNNYKVISADAVVVGAGILGLLLAKRLLDFGQKVILIDKSLTVANGASAMNHGWVHQGSAPSLTANNKEHARSIVKKLQYGHTFYKTYAPECFDEPFDSTYAVTANPAKAARAREIWPHTGLDFDELSTEEFAQVDSTMDPEAAKFYFRVPESRINNRLLLLKLFTDVRNRGGIVFMGADYEYEGEHEIRITAQQETWRVRSQMFFYSTGINLNDSYHKFTGRPLGIQYCKSHLLYLPRFTNASAIGLDPGTPIVINHGNVSVVNRSYDEVPASSNTDLALDPTEVERSLEVLYKHYPEARRLRPHTVTSKAFLKPFFTKAQGAGRHSADQSVFEPRPGHIFALPGKMTAAPYVADQIIHKAVPALNLTAVTGRPFDPAVMPLAGPEYRAGSISRPVALTGRLLHSIFSR
ncbi:MAG TPA: FAD-dependent oxidoreductase [Candidatus Saccharimonadia bacterium]|nr:FAD-dependent oxidoreductase [Candidatus Saccharimonadia bacterium]